MKIFNKITSLFKNVPKFVPHKYVVGEEIYVYDTNKFVLEKRIIARIVNNIIYLKNYGGKFEPFNDSYHDWNLYYQENEDESSEIYLSYDYDEIIEDMLHNIKLECYSEVSDERRNYLEYINKNIRNQTINSYGLWSKRVYIYINKRIYKRV